MMFVKKEHKKFNKTSHSSFILGGDIGGTNANLGIFGVNGDCPELLESLHFQSSEIDGLHEAINEALRHARLDYGLEITKACIAVAGALSPNMDSAYSTNIKWKISKRGLLSRTSLDDIVLINDFEAVGYGINMLTERDVRKIHKGAKVKGAPIVVVGAGAGLGKSILVYCEHEKSYKPVATEAGHSDFPVQTDEEAKLVRFISKKKKSLQVSYEDVLSGKGLVNIYSFLKSSEYPKTEFTKEIDESPNQQELISLYRNKDEICRNVFRLFTSIYARFARNAALDPIAYGGVYIGGGIASKNPKIFDDRFAREFENNEHLRHVLSKVPVYLILNYNAGLLGAGFAAARLLNKN